MIDIRRISERFLRSGVQNAASRSRSWQPPRNHRAYPRLLDGGIDGSRTVLWCGLPAIVPRPRDWVDTTREVLERALQALVETRLVRRDLQHNAEYYEVVTEYLAPWIAQQRRERDAQLARQRTERRLRSTRYRTTVLSALGLAVSIAVTVHSIAQARQATARHELDGARAQVAALERVVTASQTERNRAEQLASALARRTSADARQKGSTMFGSTILEIAIGLALLYTLLSLICTVLNELMAALSDARARQLSEGLQQLLGDAGLVVALYRHPLIRGRAPIHRRPSYIPSTTFAYVLLDTIGPGASNSADTLR